MDTVIRLTEINERLVLAFTKLGATCEQASEAFRSFGKVGIQLEGPHKTAWGRFSFENKVKWRQKTRPWR